MTTTPKGVEADDIIQRPDLSEYTNPEARAVFATRVAQSISNEIGVRCKDIESCLVLFENVGFDTTNGYYTSMQDKFHELFQVEIDATLEKNGWEYVDVTLKGKSWDECKISGGALTEAEDIASKNEAKKTLTFRYS